MQNKKECVNPEKNSTKVKADYITKGNIFYDSQGKWNIYFS